MIAAEHDAVVGIVRRHLPGLPSGVALAADRPLTELGLTSLRAVDLLLDLEDCFDMTLPDEFLDVATLRTLGSLLGALDRHRAEAAR
jgi:acyl carrier protein